MFKYSCSLSPSMCSNSFSASISRLASMHNLIACGWILIGDFSYLFISNSNRSMIFIMCI